MSIEIWLTFVLAAFVVLIIPGLTIILVISQAIAHGRKAVFPLVAGVTLGDFTAMTLSLLGTGFKSVTQTEGERSGIKDRRDGAASQEEEKTSVSPVVSVLECNTGWGRELS